MRLGTLTGGYSRLLEEIKNKNMKNNKDEDNNTKMYGITEIHNLRTSENAVTRRDQKSSPFSVTLCQLSS